MITVTSTVKLYFEKRIEGITSLNRNVNFDQARQKFDGRAEARIIEKIACEPAMTRKPIRKAPAVYSITEEP